MSPLSDLILRLSNERLERVRAHLELAAPRLAEAAELLLSTCLNGHRVYLCPQRETQSLAEQIAGLLLRGVVMPRPGLPVVLLHPLPGEGPSCGIQIGSLASPGDTLLALSGGRQKGLDVLIERARQHDMRLILMGTALADSMMSQLQDDDLVISFDTSCPTTLHETSLAAAHALCEALDHRLLGMA